MFRQTAFAVLGAAALALAGGTAAFPLDHPPPGGPTRGPTPQAGPVHVFGRTPREPGRKLCAWRSAEGGGFGRSGFCGIGSGASIGSPCECRFRTGGDGNRGIYKSYSGQVIAQPLPGPPPVVR